MLTTDQVMLPGWIPCEDTGGGLGQQHIARIDEQ